MPSLVKIGIGFKLVLKGRNENKKSLQTDRRTKNVSSQLFCLTRFLKPLYTHVKFDY